MIAQFAFATEIETVFSKMFSVIVEDSERPSKKCRTELRNLTLIGTVAQYETTSLEIDHPPQIIELVIDRPDKESSSESDSDSDNDVDNVDSFWTTELSASEYQSQYVARTPEQCLEEMKAPQRSDLWLKARKNCITASQFGTAIGNNPQSSCDAMLIEKLWKPFEGNDATRYGTLHEPCAERSFRNQLDTSFTKSPHEEFILREYGLLKHPSLPWIGVSPDGIFQKVNHSTKQIEWQVLEQKCPYFLRDSSGAHPQKKWPDCVPPQQRNQVQGVSGYLAETNVHFWQDQACPDRKWPFGQIMNPKPLGVFFVVWTPSKTFVTELPFEEASWTYLLRPKLKDFYFQKMLPALTHKQNGRLQENSLSARATIYG